MKLGHKRPNNIYYRYPLGPKIMLMDFKGPISMIEAFKPKVLECLLALGIVRLLVGLIE